MISEIARQNKFFAKILKNGNQIDVHVDVKSANIHSYFRVYWLKIALRRPRLCIEIRICRLEIWLQTFFNEFYGSWLVLAISYLKLSPINKLEINKYISNFLFPEAATGEVLYKKVFLKILQNSQANAWVRASYLIKLQVWGLQFYLKSLWRRCFPVDFCKIFKNIFFTEHFRATVSVFRTTTELHNWYNGNDKDFSLLLSISVYWKDFICLRNAWTFNATV